MKIIAPAALVAATLVLTAAVPALADGDHKTPAPHSVQKSPHTTIANSAPGYPKMIETEEDLDGELYQGLLPRLVHQVL